MEPTRQEPPEKQDLISEYHSGIRELEIQGYETVVKKARNALFWAGGLIFIGEMISMFRIYGQPETFFVLFALGEAAVFIGLALYTKRKPYTAIVLGLVAFIAVIVLSVVTNGMEEGGIGVAKALFSGILVKVLILVALIRPLKEAKELQELKKNDGLGG